MWSRCKLMQCGHRRACIYRWCPCAASHLACMLCQKGTSSVMPRTTASGQAPRGFADNPSEQMARLRLFTRHLEALASILGYILRCPAKCGCIMKVRSLLGDKQSRCAGDVWHSHRCATHGRVPRRAYIGGPNVNAWRCHVHALVAKVAPVPASKQAGLLHEIALHAALKPLRLLLQHASVAACSQTDAYLATPHRGMPFLLVSVSLQHDWLLPCTRAHVPKDL